MPADHSPTATSANSHFPAEGTLLGIDNGSKRIGLAISSPDWKFTFPLQVYQRRSLQHDLEHLKRIIKEHAIKGLVLGLPMHMSGDEGEQAQLARKLGQELVTATALPLAYVDERFSSLHADQLMELQALKPHKRKERRDALAASVLLQTFIERGSIEVYRPEFDRKSTDSE